MERRTKTKGTTCGRVEAWMHQYIEKLVQDNLDKPKQHRTTATAMAQSIHDDLCGLGGGKHRVPSKGTIRMAIGRVKAAKLGKNPRAAQKREKKEALPTTELLPEPDMPMPQTVDREPIETGKVAIGAPAAKSGKRPAPRKTVPLEGLAPGDMFRRAGGMYRYALSHKTAHTPTGRQVYCYNLDGDGVYVGYWIPASTMVVKLDPVAKGEPDEEDEPGRDESYPSQRLPLPPMGKDHPATFIPRAIYVCHVMGGRAQVQVECHTKLSAIKEATRLSKLTDKPVHILESVVVLFPAGFRLPLDMLLPAYPASEDENDKGGDD
jgi:hypothetical protein